jgi:hypothetical protein
VALSGRSWPMDNEFCGRFALGNTCSQPSSSTVILSGIEQPEDNAL